MKSIAKLVALTTACLFATGIILLLVMKLLGQDSVEGVVALSTFFEQKRMLFTAFRMSLLTLVFWQWDPFINWLSARYHWDDEMRDIIIEARWQILAWFIVFEIVVNQNLIGFAIN